MIAMTLGLMLVASIAAIYLRSGRSYAEDQRFSRMQENGRFALNMLAEDLAMAGFWGGVTNLSTVTSALTSSCGVTLNLANPAVQILNNATAAGANSAFSCINASTFRANTDVLMVKRVEGMSTTSGQQNGEVYLRVVGASGSLLEYSAAPSPGEIDWRFVPRIYYIRNVADPDNNTNTIPTLYRKYLSGNSLNNEEPLIDGVEDIQIEFGINAGTGVNVGIHPNYYSPAPSSDELRSAVTARVYVLVRSRDPDPAYSNAKTYRLGSKEITAADNYYRRVFTTTVALRNPAFLNRLN